MQHASKAALHKHANQHVTVDECTAQLGLFHGQGRARLAHTDDGEVRQRAVLEA